MVAFFVISFSDAPGGVNVTDTGANYTKGGHNARQQAASKKRA